MCGRASLIASPEDLEAAFDLSNLPPVVPRYNIAPTEPILIVRATESGAREAARVRWGLVRPGAEDARAVINLRMEIARKGAMKSTVRHRRCIVPLTGFYEWKREGKRRQPFNIRRRDGAVFGVAGIWERLESADLAPLESCLVLTTAPNAIVKPIHNRMPVILDPSAYASWLDPAPRELPELFETVRLIDEDHLERYAVSTVVNRAGVEDPRCVEPLASA
jgi:putative SOS response-associated peptidase YedK